MSREYIIHHEPGAPLTYDQRIRLGAEWNRLIKTGCRVTLRSFALPHGLTEETWRREYLRGATGAAIRDPKDARRRIYAEYDPFKAQDSINYGNANKGTKMLVTNQMKFLFQRHVLDEKLSPYDAVCIMAKEMPGQHIPCVSTWYKHINANDIGVPYGSTPYHPNKRNRTGPKPHPAKTVPGRLQIEDRPLRFTQCFQGSELRQHLLRIGWFHGPAINSSASRRNNVPTTRDIYTTPHEQRHLPPKLFPRVALPQAQQREQDFHPQPRLRHKHIPPFL